MWTTVFTVYTNLNGNRDDKYWWCQFKSSKDNRRETNKQEGTGVHVCCASLVHWLTLRLCENFTFTFCVLFILTCFLSPNVFFFDNGINKPWPPVLSLDLVFYSRSHKQFQISPEMSCIIGSCCLNTVLGRFVALSAEKSQLLEIHGIKVCFRF